MEKKAFGVLGYAPWRWKLRKEALQTMWALQACTRWRCKRSQLSNQQFKQWQQKWCEHWTNACKRRWSAQDTKSSTRGDSGIAICWTTGHCQASGCGEFTSSFRHTQAGQELEKSSIEQSGELNLVLQQSSKLILKMVSMQDIQNTQFLEEHTYTWKTKLMMHLLM